MTNVGRAAGIAAAAAALCITGFAVAAAEGPAKQINACSLLTIDEISAVMGAKVAPGDLKEAPSGQDDAFASTCVWRVEASEGAENPSLPLQGKSYAILNTISWPAGSGGAAHYLQEFWDAGENGLIPHKPVAVKTVGDDALFWGDGVAVRKGNVSFGISVHLPDGNPAQQSMEVSLAQKVVPRL